MALALVILLTQSRRRSTRWPTRQCHRLHATCGPHNLFQLASKEHTGTGRTLLRNPERTALLESRRRRNPLAEPSKSPDAFVADAQARVSRLQAAVDLLGVDNPDTEPLKASLETAKRQCRVHRVGEGLDPCLKFVERAQRRIERQKKVVKETQLFLAKWESQWAAGLQDLERLRAEARESPVPPASHAESASDTVGLQELRREVEQLERERNEW